MPAPASRTAQGFLWIFILVGMVAMGFGVSILYRSGQTNHWPVTDGVILASATQFHPGDHGGGTYSAEISYHYQVNGADHTGRRWAIGSLSSSSAYAQGIVNRYPAGKKFRFIIPPPIRNWPCWNPAFMAERGFALQWERFLSSRA